MRRKTPILQRVVNVSEIKSSPGDPRKKQVTKCPDKIILYVKVSWCCLDVSVEFIGKYSTLDTDLSEAIR